MRHIRIGKDISLRWAITTDGAELANSQPPEEDRGEGTTL